MPIFVLICHVTDLLWDRLPWLQLAPGVSALPIVQQNLDPRCSTIDGIPWVVIDQDMSPYAPTRDYRNQLPSTSSRPRQELVYNAHDGIEVLLLDHRLSAAAVRTLLQNHS
jgi:hypothetical protein